MTPAFRTLVVGCGAIAHEHLGYLSQAPHIEVAGVCDQSPAMAAFAAERYGAARAFSDVREALAGGGIDVVHVLTPPQTHTVIATQALDAGAHVICEKPLGGTAEETRAILRHAAAAGRAVLESRNLLFNDEVVALDELVATEQLGAIREVDILLSLDIVAGPFGDLNLAGPGVQLPGGAVHDFLPHLAYLFLHFAGAGDATVVGGVLDNLSGNPRVGFDHLDVLLRAGACRGRLRVATDLAPDQFRVVVHGSRRRAETDFYNPYLRVEGAPNVGKRAPLELVRSGWRMMRSGRTNFTNKVRNHGSYHGMPRMLGTYYAALAGERPLPVTDAQMIEAAELMDRIVALGAAA